MLKIAVSVLVLAAAATAVLPAVQAQQVGGGVDMPGEWWLGEGLKKGDFFSYETCHVNYKECTSFEVDFWIVGNKQVGSEEKWLAKTVVYDGGKAYKGEIEFGKITAEPTGGSDNLITYRTALKSSVSWLSSFATSYGGQGGEGPKEFRMPSWGKIGNIGGEQVRPLAIEPVTVPAGKFETVRVSWKTGGVHSNIWIVDEFPFPIKASTWTHVSSGKPPQEYKFSLLEYRQNVVDDPFANVKDAGEHQVALGCPDNDNLQFTFLKKSTVSFAYGLEVGYKPEMPKHGCDIEWLIKFKSKYQESEFLNQVQYDILVVDERQSFPPLRSLGGDENVDFLYSPSGLAERTMTVREDPGLVNYMIIVYGLAPDFVVPDFTKTPTDTLLVPITVLRNEAAGDSAPPSQTPDSPARDAKIPSWVRSNAGLWSDGMIDDNTFLVGLQYLIQEGFIVIPDARPGGAGSGDASVPGWVRSNAGLWSDGLIDDGTFLTGIKYLVQHGMIRISP